MTRTGNPHREPAPGLTIMLFVPIIAIDGVFLELQDRTVDPGVTGSHSARAFAHSDKDWEKRRSIDDLILQHFPKILTLAAKVLWFRQRN